MGPQNEKSQKDLSGALKNRRSAKNWQGKEACQLSDRLKSDNSYPTLADSK